MAFSNKLSNEDYNSELFNEICNDTIDSLNVFITDIANEYHVDLDKIFRCDPKYNLIDLMVEEIYKQIKNKK